MVNSVWGKRIKQAAIAKFPATDGITAEGIPLDEKLPLILVKPIRYSNLRAIDVSNVSIIVYVCICVRIDALIAIS